MKIEKENYRAPSIAVIELSVEQGIAESETGSTDTYRNSTEWSWED